MDKIYLFTTEYGTSHATAQQTQFDAETQFSFVYGEEVDYTIKEVELDSIKDSEEIEWF